MKNDLTSQQQRSVAQVFPEIDTDNNRTRDFPLSLGQIIRRLGNDDDDASCVEDLRKQKKRVREDQKSWE